MNLKGFLAVCATATVLTTGAQAADAIIFPDPEPAEYVRVCDVYGAGFFYIPGTETCLKIGGYFRFDVGFDDFGHWSLARFAPHFDVQTQTEWGTLRSYAELEFDVLAPVGGTTTSILEAYIEFIGQSGAFRAGYFENPYSTFLEYGGLNIVDTDFYPYFPSTGFSYTFTGANGFSAVLAVLDRQVPGWSVGLEGGLKFEQDWGSVGAIVGYDTLVNEWGATGAAIGKFGSVTAKLQAFYSSDLTGASAYAIVTPFGNVSRWSALGSVAAEFTPQVGAALTAQWFDISNEWLVQGELQFTPVPDFQIVPAVRYVNSGAGASVWSGLVRFQRDF